MLGASLILMASLIGQAPSKSAAEKPYISTKGGYSVALPAGFVERKRQAKLAGGSIDLQVVSRKRGGTQLFVASGTLESNPAETEAVLTAARDDVVAQSKGKLGEDRAVSFGDVPGREFRFTIPKQVVAGGATGLGRVFLSGKSVYQVVAIQSAADAINFPAEPTNFVGSFRLSGNRATAAKPREVARASPAPATAAVVMGGKPGVVESKEWGYRARFPGKPEFQELVGKSGMPEHMAKYVDGTVIYILHVTRSPARLPPSEARVFKEGIRKRIMDTGTNVRTREVKGAIPAEETTATLDKPRPNSFNKFRTLVTGKRLYLVGFVDLSPGGRTDRGDAFLESFQVVEPDVFGIENYALPDSWKPYLLPGEAGFILLPQADKAAQLGVAFEEKTAWDAKAVRATDGEQVFIAVMAEKPSAQGRYTNADHTAVARAVSVMGKQFLTSFSKTDNGVTQQWYSGDVKDYLGQGPKLVRGRTCEIRGRIYGFFAVMSPSVENEARIEAFFESLRIK